jgi:hypothetical protein
MATAAVTRVGQLPRADIETFLARFELTPVWIDNDAPIPASYWGDPEAGIAGCEVFLRADTPVHSMLHETCHVVCMDEDRRNGLERDAGGDDLEESAVCYLQVLLADYLPGVGREVLMRDMDAWGYSFRLGSTERWFVDDADDARRWLLSHRLIDASGAPAFRLRTD